MVYGRLTTGVQTLYSGEVCSYKYIDPVSDIGACMLQPISTHLNLEIIEFIYLFTRGIFLSEFQAETNRIQYKMLTE